MSFSSWNSNTRNKKEEKNNFLKLALYLHNSPFLLFFRFFLFLFSQTSNIFSNLLKNLDTSSSNMHMHRRLLETEISVAPANGNRTHDGYLNETSFDTNMVIILAALLCALICALGLNSIVRCTLRCSHRFAMETPEQAAVRLATTGLKKRHLRQIPVAVYGVSVDIPATECPICLGEFVDGEKVRVLPKCNHGFHVRCIDTWLLSHSSCPNCRHSLLEKTATSTEVEEVADGRPPENVSGQLSGVVVVNVNEAS
ncbi:hypothetical protein ACOSQ2_029402 [Xanthoceras sorbifolium]